MASDQAPFPAVPPPDISSYTHWPGIFRSWFWRYYDQLGRLVFYNLAWFLAFFFLSWVPFRKGWLFTIDPKGFHLHPWGLFLFYMAECGLSVGWAYLIFEIFCSGKVSLTQVWRGTRRYFLKALAASALSAIVMGTALFNLRFYYFQGFSHVPNLLLAAVTFWIVALWFASSLYHWPLLFFQDPPFHKLLYRSFLLTLANGIEDIGILAFLTGSFCLFSVLVVPWFFLGFVYFFSFSCVMLEKHMLKYKITYGDKPLGPFLEQLEAERQRSWREILKPWGNR